MSGEKIFEGIFDVSSADVIRKLQHHFKPSELFRPWLEAEQKARQSNRENKYTRRRRHSKDLEVKIGHGGTLDPLATGVLVTGIGKGTKQLNDFLGCTKTYEAVLLFGAETDSYDRAGKIVRRAPYEHITREAVEKALAQFRGKVMQYPPIFSALKVKGKKLYEYAREGQVPPVEIQARPVEVSNLEILEWYEPGAHEHKWPEEASEEEKSAAEKLLAKDDTLPVALAVEGEGEGEGQSTKHKLSPAPGSPRKEGEAEGTETATESTPATKKQKVSEEGDAAQPTLGGPSENQPTENPTTDASTSNPTASEPTSQPPAVKITMTVSSGFYVRSLAHDLGKALGSCGLMSELIRTRQANFELDSDKILEYQDLDAGEEVWGPKVQRFLEEWEQKREREARTG